MSVWTVYSQDQVFEAKLGDCKVCVKCVYARILMGVGLISGAGTTVHVVWRSDYVLAIMHTVGLKTPHSTPEETSHMICCMHWHLFILSFATMKFSSCAEHICHLQHNIHPVHMRDELFGDSLRQGEPQSWTMMSA